MTQIFVADPRGPGSRRGLLAQTIRDLVRTISIYLGVAFISGLSYALCAVALNGGTFVRLWLASLAPIALFLVARFLLQVYRRGFNAGASRT